MTRACGFKVNQLVWASKQAHEKGNKRVFAESLNLVLDIVRRSDSPIEEVDLLALLRYAGASFVWISKICFTNEFGM
jgi:hypothetical protein